MPVLALVLATFFWGSSFITVGSALEYTNPLTLVMLRFGVAAFFVLLMLKGRIADIPKRTWKAGAACAFLIYLGYTTNAAGLMTLQSSESGFLTALYVPITPLLVWVVFGKAPTKGAVFGVMMAFAGLVLLANPFTLSFSNNWGEWVTILSALISAVEIMVVGRVAPGTQARQLAFTQLFFTAVFAAVGLAVATAAGVPLKETTFNTTVVGGILWLAVIVAFVQVLLSWAQRYVPAGRAAVIFAMESVFAAIIGWFAGESLGTAGIIVGILDSGFGGLSVARAVAELLPQENLVYAADCGFAPWGDRTDDFILERTHALVSHLLRKDVKAIVIACNTATAVCAESLRAELSMPVVGIEPAVLPGARTTRTGIIGVMATTKTLASAKYRHLKSIAPKEVRIIDCPCPGLMDCVEAGEFRTPHTMALLREYVEPLVEAGADTLVLGCTHYPFLSDAIRLTAGPGIRLIDPAPAVARQLKRRLDEPGLLNDTKKAPARIFCTTDANEARERILRLLWTDNAVLQKLDGSVRP